MGEVENIGPGLTRELIVELAEPGTYVTACKPGMNGDGIRGDVHRHRRRAAAERHRRQARRGRRTATSATSTSQADALLAETDGVRRRGQGRRRRRGQGALPDRPHLLGAHRAGRRVVRRPRPEDRRPRGRPRARAGVDRLPPAREGPVGRPACSPTPAPIADQLLADVKELVDRRQGRRAHRRCSSPTAPRSCSTRSPPARSPARRTATRTPTCGTSRPTSRARRPPSPRCARSSTSATPTLGHDARRSGSPRSTTLLDKHRERRRLRALHRARPRPSVKELSDARRRAGRAGQPGRRASSPASEPSSEPDSTPAQARRSAVGAGAALAGAVAGAAGARRARAGRAPAAAPPPTTRRRRCPFHGEHQAGIVTPAQDRLHFVAFDVTTDDRDELRRAAARSGPRRPSG